MEFLIINIAFYLFTWIFYYNKRRSVDFTFVLFMAYGLVAIFGAIYYNMTPYRWHITMLPLMYLYMIFMISSAPLYRKPISVDNFCIPHRKLFTLFLWVMLVACIVSIYYSWSNALNVAAEEAWGEVYADEDKQSYVNLLDRLAKNIIGYGRIIASVLIFHNLARGTSKEKKLSVCLLILLIIAVILNSSARAARGMMLSSIISVMSGFFLFQSLYSKKLLRSLLLFGVGLIVIFFLYSYTIAQVRFGVAGSYYDPTESIYAYLGQPMLIFDYGIMDSIHTYMHGDFLFGTNPAKYYGGLDSVLGTHFGSGFFTYVGALYLDFGPLGTLIIASIIAFLMRNKCRVKDLADAFIVCYYFSFILNGVFVYGRGYYFPIMMAIITYIILKLIK